MKSTAGTLALALAVVAIALGGCSKAPATEDAGPGAAALRRDADDRAADRAELERIVALDVRASNAMRDADGAATRGDAGAASDAVTKRAMPAVDEALRAAEGANAKMKTPWGASKLAQMLAVLRERKAEMPRYAEAATSGDPERLLAAVQAQAAIERRALAAVAAIQDER